MVSASKSVKRESAWRLTLLSGPKSSIWLFMAALFVSTLPVIGHSQNKPGNQAQSDHLTVDQIVARMEEARIRTKQTPAFLLTREYQMFHGEETTPASQVKAQISVTSPGDRQFKIIDTQGSDRGEKVVRKILEHEAQAEKEHPSPTALIPANYDFTDAGREMFEGVNCFVLGLKPKREEPGLIEGRAWIDPNAFVIRKVEGKMSKSPSWWVKEVNLVVNFGEIGGIWMQTASTAIADVRVAGQYKVLGRAIDVQTANSVAMNSPQKRAFPHHHTDLSAAFIYGAGTGRR